MTKIKQHTACKGRQEAKRARVTGGGRIVAAFFVALFLHTTAFAYTLVLRSGRRVEIPANFTVTNAAVTYEAAPDINVSVQLSSIDVVATERANNEATGSLLRRAAPKVASPRSAANIPTVSSPRRKLTDRDLEASRRARQLSEERYEKRRAELGLPSSTEMQRRHEAEARSAREQLRLSETVDAESEIYWRTRAAALRNEIITLDAEINYVQARLSQLPDTQFVSPYSFGASVLATGVYPFGYPYGAISPYAGINNNYGGTQLAGSFRLGGGRARVGVFASAGNTTTNFQRRVIVAPGAQLPTLIYNAPLYPSYQYDGFYQRTALIARLHQLGEARAGLQARWRLLEEEARRAGALPGWLRPY
ncbi:MAG: hypothetical protein ABR577_02205 [Pyrinomonadaceae bacterium]